MKIPTLDVPPMPVFRLKYLIVSAQSFDNYLATLPDLNERAAKWRSFAAWFNKQLDEPTR